MRLLCLILVLLVAPLSQAQPLRTDALSPLDKQHMDTAVGELESLARVKLGRSFSGDQQRDLELIQALLDRHLVDKDDIELLQAMGIVMGRLLQQEHNLEWVVYVDKVGRSRALEVPMKEEYLFPVTQISSRVQAGAEVDVQSVYSKLEEEVARIRKKIIVP